MSDRRAEYAVGVVIVLVGIFGVSQAVGMFALTDANLTTATTTMRYLGHVTAVVYDSNGNIKSYFQTDNLVVDSGRNCATDLVFNTTFHTSTCTIVDKMAIGKSSAAVDATNTDLFLKTANLNEDSTLSNIVAAISDDDNLDDVMFTMSKSFTILVADTGSSISETGLFDDEGNMFARTLIGPIGVTTGDTITVNWDFILD